MVRARIALLCILLLTSCGTPSAETPTSAQTSVPGERQVLRIFSWETYIDPALLDQFAQEFNVEIVYDTFGSNEELYEKVVAGADYDVIVPSDYMVETMRREGFLATIDQQNIPNIKNIDPLFANPTYDPGLRYCLPYLWGTQGIGYNSATVLEPIASLGDLFGPQTAGRVALLDDPRATIGAVLIYLGYSPNTMDARQIAEARDFLKRHAPNMIFAKDDGQDRLLRGEVDYVFEWSGDMLQAISENPDLRYIIPVEGSLVWTDNLCVLHSSPNKLLAEQFLNFILDPEVGAKLANYTHYSSPNAAALPMINAEDRNNPALYPNDLLRSRLFFLVDVGSDGNRLYQEAWEEILALAKEAN